MLAAVVNGRSSREWRCVATLVATLVAGCAPEPALVVDLRTDFRAGLEVDEARVDVFEGTDAETPGSTGRRPLGAYLFSNPQWQRGPFETGLCHRANRHQPMAARRSRFFSGHHSLLVGEYFLPTLCP